MTDLPTWFHAPLPQRLFALAKQAGGEARIVGGAIRDWQAMRLGKIPATSDMPELDFATNIDIALFGARARAAGYAVYETGLSHGTITVIIDGHIAEVTQLRIDHITDGRHAQIKPTDKWAEDATRRDFTINALYLDEGGQIFDPLEGLADLKKGVLRFIGPAEIRIKEDLLRMLRALRFLAVYPWLEMQADEIEIIGQMASTLPRLSAERIVDEFRKTFLGDHALPILGLMSRLCFDQILFTQNFALEAARGERLAPLWHRFDFPQQLAFLLKPGTLYGAAKRLKLSRKATLVLAQIDRLSSSLEASSLAGDTWARTAFHAYPFAPFLYVHQRLETDQPIDQTRLEALTHFIPPVFPVSGRDIIQHWHLQHGAISAQLKVLTEKWVKSDFTLSRADLLAIKEN